MTTDPTAALARIRQMADAWEQRLPETIRTATAVDAIRTVLESAAVPVSSPPADRAAVLTDTERQFLAFALDLAADEMASRGDEFNSDDEAALEKLRRLADETPAATERVKHSGPDTKFCALCLSGEHERVADEAQPAPTPPPA